MLGRIGMLVAIVAVVGATYSLVQLLDSSGPIGSEKLIGQPLPEFAAPLAPSGLNLDANITSRLQAERGGERAACDVRVKGAFVSCRDLKGDAVVVFWRTDKPNCVRQVDELQSAFAGSEAVATAAIAFDQQVDPVARLARERGWRIPVVVDRDAAAAALFRVSGCPSTYFVRDGVFTGVRLGLLDAAQLRRAVGRGESGDG